MQPSDVVVPRLSVGVTRERPIAQPIARAQIAHGVVRSCGVVKQALLVEIGRRFQFHASGLAPSTRVAKRLLTRKGSVESSIKTAIRQVKVAAGAPRRFGSGKSFSPCGQLTGDFGGGSRALTSEGGQRVRSAERLFHILRMAGTGFLESIDRQVRKPAVARLAFADEFTDSLVG